MFRVLLFHHQVTINCIALLLDFTIVQFNVEELLENFSVLEYV
jgi:hypothetical protein